MARSHTILKDHVSALALCELAQSYISKIPSTLGSFPEKDIPVSKEDVHSLSNTLEGEMTRSHAHVILSQPNSNESTLKVPFPGQGGTDSLETVIGEVTSISETAHD